MKRLALFLLSIATTPLMAQHFCGRHHTALASAQHEHLDFAPLPGPNYDLTYNRCYWEVDPAVRYIKGIVDFYFVPLDGPFDKFNINLAANLTVDSVKWHGQNLTISRNASVLTVDLPNNLILNAVDSLTIFYQGAPISTGFGSFHVGTQATAPVLWTMSCPNNSDDWWPSKISLDDKIDSIDIIVKNPARYRAGSNGKLISDAISQGHRITRWQHRSPITSYLVAIAVTNYAAYEDQATLADGTVLPILNYVYPQDSATAVASTPALVPVLEYYDSLFGAYPYPTEKYGHAQFGWGGGMEHQTMSFVTNYDIDLLAHELAHQWFGNKVTEGSLVDCWLSEGFATYLTGLTIERFYPNRWRAWRQDALANITAGPDGSVYVTDTTNVWRIYNSQLSYDKGAYLLHMLRWRLGDQAFFDGVKNYITDPSLAYGYASTADLQRHLEATSGQNLTQFFNEWFIGEGFPRYTINWWQDASGQVSAYLSQTVSAAHSVPFFHNPVPVRFSNATRDTTIVIDHQSNGQFTGFHLSFQATTVQVDPELWLISRQNRVILGDESLEVTDNERLLLLPNPTLEHIQLRYESAKHQMATITIVDSLGKQVLCRKVEVQAGENNIQIEVAGFAAGSYIVSLKSKGSSLTGRFVKK